MVDLNEVNFRNLKDTERVAYVNQCLEANIKLKDIALKIGIPYSSMTTLLNKDGYTYSRKQKQYVPSKAEVIDSIKDDTTLLDFLAENEEVLRRIIGYYSSSTLIINPIVFDGDANFVLKNFKINENLLKEFQDLMKNQYPQYRLQDALSQALLDFLEKYR